MIHILFHDCPFFFGKICPYVLFPVIIIFCCKFFDLSSIGADLDQAIIFSGSLLHILSQGDDLSCLSGILLQSISLVLPKSLIEGTELETDVIEDLILGWDLHDGTNSSFHDPLQRGILINHFTFLFHFWMGSIMCKSIIQICYL